MARDPLDIVRRLRHRALDDVRARLTQAAMAESEAARLAQAAESRIEEEARRASDPDGDDGVVEAFARWLPVGRFRAAEARAAHERQQAEVARLRAELSTTRAGLEVIEALIAQRRADSAASEMRRLQQALEEAVRPRPEGCS